MARGINKVILIGNLGNVPEMRYSANGVAICNINLATDESYKDRNTGQNVPRVEWHRVAFFGKIAEIAHQYLKKGSKVYIEGKLQNKKWTDQNNNERTQTQIVVDMKGTMQMLDSPAKSATEKAHDYSNNTSTQGEDEASSASTNPEPVDDFDDDIPF